VKIFLQKSGRPFIKGIFFFLKKAVSLLLVGFQKAVVRGFITPKGQTARQFLL
jgi:hypothetical protein